MSLLLALGALYVTGKVLAEAGRDVKKIPARKQINEDSKKGNFDVVKKHNLAPFPNIVNNA